MSELHCIQCGVSGTANCSCGKPYNYIPAKEAAALAVAAHPTWSDRKIAEAVGVDNKTIAKARRSTEEFSSVDRTATIGRDGRTRRTTPHSDRIRAAVRERVATDAPIRARRLARELGTSHYTVEAAVLAERAILDERDDPTVDPATLSRTAQAKLEAATRQIKRKLEAEFEQAVHGEITRRLNETMKPAWDAREEDFIALRFRRKGVFSRAEYNVILKCVHPDTRPDGMEKTEAFRLIHEKRLLLLTEADDPRTYPRLPTSEEFMAGIRRQRRS